MTLFTLKGNQMLQPREVKKTLDTTLKKRAVSTDILELIYLKTKNQASKAVCRLVVKAWIDSIKESIQVNSKTVLPKFGTFMKREVKAHVGRNPRTGEAVKVPSKERVFFRPSSSLLEKE